MVKRPVLVEDDDEMLDRCCGAKVMVAVAVVILGDGACAPDHERESGYQA
jgi:hypothetical protein